jgi:hypothetical protein
MGSQLPDTPLSLPVLITAFSRYDTLREVFLAVREARPPRLYFACDGPRNADERAQCDKVRSLVGLVDWPCEVKTLFHPENLGCKYSMAANITWFFENEEEGVILEDDIVPDTSFFWFCQELLEKYRHDPRIWAIFGNNLSAPADPAARDTYWLSAHGYGAYWGWASWRRVWEKFDVEMKEWGRVGRTKEFKRYFLSKAELKEGNKLFEQTYDGRISSTWDYQLDFAKVLAGAANIIPEANLCRNIGFSGDGTHTLSAGDSRNREILHSALFPLRHPEPLELHPARDLAYFEAHILPPRFQRIKNSVKRMLPRSIERKLTPVAGTIQRKLGLG